VAFTCRVSLQVKKNDRRLSIRLPFSIDYPFRRRASAISSQRTLRNGSSLINRPPIVNPYICKRQQCQLPSRMSSSQFVKVNYKEGRLVPLPETPRSHAPGHELLPPDKPSKKQPTKDLDVALNDTNADFAIVCHGGTLSAHKSVLLAMCPYFARALRFAGSVSLDSLLRASRFALLERAHRRPTTAKFLCSKSAGVR
jgi:hypothetical protein